MAWQLDPLLLELFESVHKDLSSALEARQRLTDTTSGIDNVRLTETQSQKIEALMTAMAALRGALEQGHSAVVH